MGVLMPSSLFILHSGNADIGVRAERADGSSDGNVADFGKEEVTGVLS